MSFLKNITFTTIILCIFFCASLNVLAQSDVKKLEKKKEQLNEELKLTNQLLKETSSERKNSLNELTILEEQLTTREELLKTLKKQVVLVDDNIVRLQKDIEVKKKELEAEKKEYAKMINYAYRSRGSNSLLVFLLASESFNDAYRRLRYIKEYNDYRVNQVGKIQAQTDSVEAKINTLNEEKIEKENLAKEEEITKDKLLKEKKIKSVIVFDLQQKESELEDELDQKQVALSSLESEITSIIEAALKKKKAEEVAAEKAAIAAKRKAEKAAKKSKKSTPPKPAEVAKKTPEVDKLSTSFASNKGKLPWPVSQGIITGKFGTSEHSSVSNVKINNTGIDISTKKNSEVRAVFDGEVTNIIFSPVFQNAIIVKHGNYFSVYSNLKTVSVSKGEQIKTKQVIGTVSTAAGKTEVHFEIWKETTKLNPAYWLAKR